MPVSKTLKTLQYCSCGKVPGLWCLLIRLILLCKSTVTVQSAPCKCCSWLEKHLLRQTHTILIKVIKQMNLDNVTRPAWRYWLRLLPLISSDIGTRPDCTQSWTPNFNTLHTLICMWFCFGGQSKDKAGFQVQYKIIYQLSIPCTRLVFIFRHLLDSKKTLFGYLLFIWSISFLDIVRSNQYKQKHLINENHHIISDFSDSFSICLGLCSFV